MAFDTLKSIGETDKTNTLFLAHSPGAVSDQILESMLVAEKANGRGSKAAIAAQELRTKGHPSPALSRPSQPRNAIG